MLNRFVAFGLIAFCTKIYLTLSISCGTPDQIFEESTEIAIVRELLKNYNWKMRPMNRTYRSGKQKALTVSVNMLLRTISKIDDVNMEYSTQFTFRQHWRDSRLAYGSGNRSVVYDNGTFSIGNQSLPLRTNCTTAQQKELPPFVILAPGDHSEQIWLPDTFFQNEKSAQKHMIDKPNVLIRIYQNGDILYSVRLSLVLSCTMSLIYYPLDHQECFIDFSSYAYTTEDIVYVWTKDNPIQLKDTVETSLPSFSLSRVATNTCVSNTSTGEYSCLRVELHFKRMISYYLLQLYIPSFMLVIVSWVSFWVDKSSVPARVTLGVTTLLTITTQASGINAKLPPVSYTKAIDIWIGVCLAFVFCALLEYALVNYAGHEAREKRNVDEEAMSNSSRVPTTTAYEKLPSDMSPLFQMNEHFMSNKRRPSCFPSSMEHRQPQYQTLAAHKIGWADEPRFSCHSCGSVNGGAGHAEMAGTSFGDLERLGEVRSLADRRLTVLSGKWTAKAPIYVRVAHWVRDMYNEADKARKIDVVARFAFPLLFFFFNCAYWFAYSSTTPPLKT